MAWVWFEYSQGLHELVPTVRGKTVATASDCGGQMNEPLRSCDWILWDLQGEATDT